MSSHDSGSEMQSISILCKRRLINIFNLYNPPNQVHLPANLFDFADADTIFLGDLNAIGTSGALDVSDVSPGLFWTLLAVITSPF
ncbi:hypothetical protein TNCT_489861 [Trichonephila clavata]|uniref:Endonuclease/exonuclease/phosphatase domain-containing protein n=1 Tax=Trichonephila clavata TaxID=2740835 RepID=A0A8X6IUA9_TRICU|nr:hypothetical protein TNCT_489861 [Trichonephila clavata]